MNCRLKTNFLLCQFPNKWSFCRPNKICFTTDFCFFIFESVLLFFNFQICFREVSVTFHRWLTFWMYFLNFRTSKACSIEAELVEHWSSWSSWIFSSKLLREERRRVCCSGHCFGEKSEHRYLKISERDMRHSFDYLNKHWYMCRSMVPLVGL